LARCGQQRNNAALIDVAGQTHLVKVGNYMGQNFGLVTKITETEVELKEIVQDAAASGSNGLRSWSCRSRNAAAREQAMSITIKGLANRVSRFAAALGLLAVTGTAAAQSSGENAIERIDALQTTTGVVVSIELKKPGDRRAAELLGRESGARGARPPADRERARQEPRRTEPGDVRSVNVVQAGGRSRVW